MGAKGNPIWSEELEQAALSAALLDAAKASQVLRPELFYAERHATIYRAIADLVGKGQEVDPVTVGTMLNSHIDAVGGMEYLGTLIDLVPTGANIASYASQLEELAGRRKVIAAAQAAITAAENQSIPLADVTAALSPGLTVTTGQGFATWTADELATQPPAEWLIEGLLPAKGLTVLVGAPESAKTFLAIDLAASVATGSPVRGRSVRQGSVLFIAAEGQSGVLSRVRAWEEHHGELTTPALRFIDHGVDLRDRETVRRLRATVTAYQPQIVVFDTLARCLPGADENSALDMGQAIASLDGLRQLGAAVLVLHHAGWGAADRERGSSALRGAADATYLLKRDADDTLTLENLKQKEAPHIASERFRLLPVGASCVLEPVEGTVLPTLTTDMRKCLKSLMESFEGGEASTTEWMRASGTPGTTFYRYRKALIGMGLVTEAGKKRYRVSIAGELELGGSHGTTTAVPRGEMEVLPTTNPQGVEVGGSREVAP